MESSLNYTANLERFRERLATLRVSEPFKTRLLALMFPVTALLMTPLTSKISGVPDSDAAFVFGFLHGLIAAGVFLLLLLRQERPMADFTSGRVVLDYSRKISQSCEEPLQRVIEETEQSALDIIGQVKKLDTTATQLINYLTKADQDTLDMQTRIDQSTTIIERISAFISQLPAKIDAERQLMEKIQAIVHLTGEVAETVQDVSRQTNMVALNIIIQAAHVGEQGRGLTVVANEMRRLSERGNEAAKLVTQAVNDIQEPMRAYTCEFQRDFTQDMHEVTQVTGSVHELQDSYEDMKQYYRTLLTVIKDHNTHMAEGIVDTLGNIQYQDVVRQRLERVLAAQARYRDVLQAALDDAAYLSSPHFQEALEQVLSHYREEESRHGAPSATDSETVGLRIELF